jgi:hypothetical protein
MRLTPDFGMALVAAGVLGLGWSLARTGWIWRILHTPRKNVSGTCTGVSRAKVP